MELKIPGLSDKMDKASEQMGDVVSGLKEIAQLLKEQNATLTLLAKGPNE